MSIFTRAPFRGLKLHSLTIDAPSPDAPLEQQVAFASLVGMWAASSEFLTTIPSVEHLARAYARHYPESVRRSE